MRRHRKLDLAELAAIVAAVLLCGWMTWRTFQFGDRLDKTSASLAVTTAELARTTATLVRVERRVGDEHTQLANACVRLNILRASDNRSHLQDFVLYEAVERVPLGSLASTIRVVAEGKEWTPVTDCNHAVATSGAGYRAPESVRFVDRKPTLWDLCPGKLSSAYGGPDGRATAPVCVARIHPLAKIAGIRS